MLSPEVLKKLDAIESRFEELTHQLSDPGVVSSGERYRKVAKERASVEAAVTSLRAYRKLLADIADNEAFLAEKDPELRELAKEELAALRPRVSPAEEELKRLLVPKDPNDEKDVILEIRAGAGGDAARLALRGAPHLARPAGRREGRHRHHLRRRRLLVAQVRVGRAPRPARARHRGAGPHPHLHRHGGGDARGGGDRHPDQPGRPGDGRLPVHRVGRPVGEHHRLGGAHHPQADRRDREVPAGEVAAEEPQHGDEDAAREAVRAGAGEAAERARRDAEEQGRLGRPPREDPHLQLPAGPADRPPHQLHPPQPAGGDGRRRAGPDRRLPHPLRRRGAARGVTRADRSRLRRAARLTLTNEQWTPLKLLAWTQGFFARAGVDSPRLTAELLLAHALGCDRVRLYLDFDKPLGAPELGRYRELVRR